MIKLLQQIQLFHYSEKQTETFAFKGTLMQI